LDLCQKVYPRIMAVFINTGNEWPEIIQFINRIKNDGHTNLVILRPSLTPHDTWRQVGFPLVSKEVAQKVELIRKSPTCATAQKWLRPDNPFKLGRRWQYLLQEDYHTSSKCCDILKKRPAKQFEKETGRSPIIGIMAAESKMRESKYLQMGSCNNFAERGRSVSWPLAIWNDDDIWVYIEKRKLPIADIYRKGITRTGCVGCGFGAYRKDEDNPQLRLLYTLHPKYYNMIMNYTNSGVTYREALRKVKATTGCHLPDEFAEV